MTDAQTRTKLDIQKEAICLNLQLGKLGTRRKIRTSQITTDADPEMVHVSKDILESNELKTVIRYRSEIKKYLNARCLPSPFRSGVYLLRLAMIEDVMKKMAEFEAQDWINVQIFLEFYERIYAQRHDPDSEFAQKLGTLYSADDYPHPDKVKESFTLTVQLWELSTPGALRTIDRALYEREAAKMQNVWKEAQQQITQVLLTEFRDMTARMAERLQSSPDGKPKVFRDSLVGNLQEWLDLFEKRDLSNDEQLMGFVNQARAMVNGLKPDAIRETTALREEIAQEMQNITKQLDQAIVERPGRRIEWEDDAVQA